MHKIILITGATDGIGLETAKGLAAQGHHLLIHGRNPAKLAAAEQTIQDAGNAATIETFLGDLSSIGDIDELAAAVAASHDRLDVVINNAGVFKTATPITADGLDVRFVVNTIAPYRLTQQILGLLGSSSRIINLSSAAQAPVDPRALAGEIQLADFDAYAQSKLALTMWSRHLAESLGETGPAVIAVNPGSMLATNMVRDGFGVPGNDIGIGADILMRAALDDEFAGATGTYFDNDAGRFNDPHPAALDPTQVRAVVGDIAAITKRLAAKP